MFFQKLKKNVVVSPNYITAPDLKEQNLNLIRQEQKKRDSEEIQTHGRKCTTNEA